jgi:hypothetical protein
MDVETLTPLLQTLKPTEQILLLQLVARAQGGLVAASQSQLATWTGTTRRTVKVGLRKLAEVGALRVVASATSDGAAATFELRLVSGAVVPTPPDRQSPATALTPDNRLRLQAIKQTLSPARWDALRREAQVAGLAEDDILLRYFFGPARRPPATNA